MIKHSYYHNSISRAYSFLIPAQSSILFYGSVSPSFLNTFDFKKIVCIDPLLDYEIKDTGNKKIIIHKVEYEYFFPEDKFDYIILDFALGHANDICKILNNISKACKPDTRIIIHQQNYLWQWVLNLGGQLGFKRKEKTQNWLSTGDIKSYLQGCGFEHTRSFKKNIFPVFFLGIGPLLNWFFTIIPVLDFFKLDQFVIARPLPSIIPDYKKPTSLSIVITVRNEAGNIEPIIKSIPSICQDQEIIFVEGHSTDGTIEEINKMIKIYPEKNIKHFTQPGKGQGDAIKLGFYNAQKDIVILYEGDGTSTTNDILYFYDSMKNDRFEFIEGSRFVYPFDKKSMPILKKIGNIFFAIWFSWFLGQRCTDLLSGIKAIFRRNYNVIYDNWGVWGTEDPFGDWELLFGSARYGLKIGEIPMFYQPRPYGKSKTNVFKHGILLLKMAYNSYIRFRTLKISKL